MIALVDYKPSRLYKDSFMNLSNSASEEISKDGDEKLGMDEGELKETSTFYKFETIGGVERMVDTVVGMETFAAHEIVVGREVGRGGGGVVGFGGVRGILVVTGDDI